MPDTPDEIMEELWQIKDDIAREHGYDIRRLATHLRRVEQAYHERVVDPRDVGRILETVNSSDPGQEDTE